MSQKDLHKNIHATLYIIVKKTGKTKYLSIKEQINSGVFTQWSTPHR